MADLFQQKVAVYGPKLAQTLGISVLDSAAIFGNVGWECGGFEHMHEMGKRAGSGGIGWCMWTGARRKQFENYCRQHGFAVDSDQANFGFLVVELTGSEAAAVHAMRGQLTLDGKVRSFCRIFERPGVIAMPGRLRWGREALAVMQPGHAETQPPAPKSRPKVAASRPVRQHRHHRVRR